MQTRKLLWGALIALASLAAQASGPRAEFKVLPTGTSWVNEVQTSGSFGSGTTEAQVRMGRSKWKGQEVLTLESAAQTLMMSRQGAYLAVVGPDGKPVFSWDPPPRWDWPLAVGRTWKRPMNVTVHAQGVTLPSEHSGAVEAYEDVTVPAGNFKAFRIRVTDTLGNEEVAWYSPDLGLMVKRVQVRTERNAQGPGRRESALKSLPVAR